MKKFTISFFIISIFLGALLFSQIEAQRFYKRAIPSENRNDLTSQIVILTQEVENNKTKISELQNEYNEYQKVLTGKEESTKLVTSDLDKYQKFIGQKETRGKGVEISISKGLSLEEMVDFINNLKNINIAALSLNDERLIISSAFDKNKDGLTLDGKKINPPYKILALGNPDILKESLERKGGMIEKLKSTSDVEVQVEQKDNIILPAKK